MGITFPLDSPIKTCFYFDANFCKQPSLCHNVQERPFRSLPGGAASQGHWRAWCPPCLSTGACSWFRCIIQNTCSMLFMFLMSNHHKSYLVQKISHSKSLQDWPMPIWMTSSGGEEGTHKALPMWFWGFARPWWILKQIWFLKPYRTLMNCFMYL